jgi:hypothetical protein
MLLLGVDPGLSGALALLDPARPWSDKPYRLEVFDMPTCGEENDDRRVDAKALFEWLDPIERPVEYAIIERVMAMPSQRPALSGEHMGERVSMPAYKAMSFGEAVATVRTVIVCRDVKFTRVVPSVWKKEAGLAKPRRPKGAPKLPLEPTSVVKNRSRLKAIEAFPEYEDMFQRKRDENKAEAALIARYGAVKLGLLPSLDPTLLV